MQAFTAAFGFPILIIGAAFAILAALLSALGIGDDFFENLHEPKKDRKPVKYRKPTGR